MKTCMKRTIVMLAGALLLSGCGSSFPEYTAQQHDQIVNYAAGLLVRYGKNSRDRLTYLDPSYTPSYLASASVPDTPPEPVAPAPQETPAEQEPEAPAPQETSGTETTAPDAPEPVEPEQSGTGTTKEPPADNADPESGEQGEEAQAIVLENLTPIDSSRLQTLADGVRVEYNGYSVRSAYPDANAQGAVLAAAGDRLLIVDFLMRNTTDHAVEVNTALFGPSYKLVINGDVVGFTLVTMIENDLSSLLTTLAPGQDLHTVLLMELPESVAKSVNTLDLQVIVNGETQSISLE